MGFTSYMSSDRKSGLFRTIRNGTRPWAKACQCTKFHENISKKATCGLNTRRQEEQTDGYAYIDAESALP